MQLKLLSIAAAAALAFAGAAQAQTSGTPSGGGARPTVDRQAKKADEDKAKADYKAAIAECKGMKGNEHEVCEADAKGNEKVAKAELEQKYSPSPAHQRKVDEAKAEHEYKVAEQKCKAMKGAEKSACEKDAKAQHDRAKADIKQKDAKAGGSRNAATGASGGRAH
ncbi:MAG TPA: hypothetical protein VFI86_03125 [Burkholderiales bacterium]|nr:hypothetical protein [Burkholderiales bacterium]